jgi:hypothetical protein
LIQSAYREAVAEFIRTKGITRCPTACVLPTQGLVPAADRVALEEHAFERDRFRRASRCSLATIFKLEGCTVASPVANAPQRVLGRFALKLPSLNCQTISTRPVDILVQNLGRGKSDSSGSGHSELLA